MRKYTALISNKALIASDALSEYFDILCLPDDDKLPTPVSSHPDMLLFLLGKSAVSFKDYAEKNCELFDTLQKRCDVSFSYTNNENRSSYPYDISLNILLTSGIAASLSAYTSADVKSVLGDKGIALYNIHQGYAACSSLSLNCGIVSADPSVLSFCDIHRIPKLQISEGNIKLDGYNYGFIGGASGVCENKVYFLGNIEKHPDGKNILEFLETQGYEAISLFDGMLCDFGGIKFFENL